MKYVVVLPGGVEAEVHNRPGLLGKWLLGRRPTFSPIVRIGEPHSGVWIHKHTGRHVGEAVLDLLEHFPTTNDARQRLLDAAAVVDAEEIA